jgi:hypothetical protein
MSAEDREFSRRTFFKTAGVGAVGLPMLAGPLVAAALGQSGGSYPSTEIQPAGFDFTKKSGAREADTIVYSAYQFCNSNCRGGRVRSASL